MKITDKQEKSMNRAILADKKKKATTSGPCNECEVLIIVIILKATPFIQEQETTDRNVQSNPDENQTYECQLFTSSVDVGVIRC